MRLMLASCIQLSRGRVAATHRDELVEGWTATGALKEPEEEVICVISERTMAAMMANARFFRSCVKSEIFERNMHELQWKIAEINSGVTPSQLPTIRFKQLTFSKPENSNNKLTITTWNKEKQLLHTHYTFICIIKRMLKALIILLFCISLCVIYCSNCNVW